MISCLRTWYLSLQNAPSQGNCSDICNCSKLLSLTKDLKKYRKIWLEFEKSWYVEAYEPNHYHSYLFKTCLCTKEKDRALQREKKKQNSTIKLCQGNYSWRGLKILWLCFSISLETVLEESAMWRLLICFKLFVQVEYLSRYFAEQKKVQ